MFSKRRNYRGSGQRRSDEGSGVFVDRIAQVAEVESMKVMRSVSVKEIQIGSFLGAISKQRIAQNLGNTIYYMGGNAVQFLVAIFTLPIYSRYLSPTDFAILGYYTAINAFLFPVFDLSMNSYYLTNYYSPYTVSTDEELSYAVNVLNIANIAVGIAGFFIIAVYFGTFHVEFPLYPYVLIVLLYLFFSKYRTLFLIDARIRKKGLQYFLLSASGVLFTAIFSLSFVIGLRAGAAGRLGGQLAAQLLVAVVVLSIWIRRKRIKFHVTFAKAKLLDSFKFAWPLILAGYSYYPIGNIDKIFLERLHDPKEFGFYSVGLFVANYVGVFFSLFIRALNLICIGSYTAISGRSISCLSAATVSPYL